MSNLIIEEFIAMGLDIRFYSRLGDLINYWFNKTVGWGAKC